VCLAFDVRNCGLSLFATSTLVAVCLAFDVRNCGLSLFRHQPPGCGGVHCLWSHLDAPKLGFTLWSHFAPILFLVPGDIIVWLAVHHFYFWMMTSLSSWHTLWLMHYLYLWNNDTIT
jgi:hypothetical protein